LFVRDLNDTQKRAASWAEDPGRKIWDAKVWGGPR
jgi:hypothetical protein